MLKVATMPKRPRWWRRAVRHRLAWPLALWLLSIAFSYWVGDIKSTPISLLSWGVTLVMILTLWWSTDVSNRMFVKIQKARQSLIEERLALGEWNRAQAIKMRRHIYGEDRDFR